MRHIFKIMNIFCRFLIRIERAKVKNQAPPDLQITEDNVSLKVGYSQFVCNG